MKRTKIVATIGPSSEKKVVLRQMMKAGLNVARLNFSHNVHKHHLMLIKNIREVAGELGKTITILQDLQGPRIRIGNIMDAGVEVKSGDKVVLFYSLGKMTKVTNPVRIPIHYQTLYRDVKMGEKVLIDDGLIELKIEKIDNKEIHCEVIIGGKIKNHKGMNFPESKIKAGALTKKDIEDLEFGIKNGVDFVAFSFVKDARDVRTLRDYINKFEKKYNKAGQKGSFTKIIAKIERREAITNFDKILKAADGIMVARGDLGIELPFEDVPLIQKEIIHKCNFAGKPVIVATQMLDSMIRNPLPTRAEVSDVANAILDGTDAIMLSGESASGQYPLEAVKAMDRVAKEIEPTEFKIQQELEPKLKRIKSLVDFAAYNAQDTAEKLKVKAMVCLTGTGTIARMVARYKSKIPLLAFTPYEPVKNQLNLTWGAESYKMDFVKDYDTVVTNIFDNLKKSKKIKKGDTILFCVGQTFSYFKRENFIRIERV